MAWKWPFKGLPSSSYSVPHLLVPKPPPGSGPHHLDSGLLGHLAEGVDDVLTFLAQFILGRGPTVGDRRWGMLPAQVGEALSGRGRRHAQAQAPARSLLPRPPSHVGAPPIPQAPPEPTEHPVPQAFSPVGPWGVLTAPACPQTSCRQCPSALHCSACSRL